MLTRPDFPTICRCCPRKFSTGREDVLCEDCRACRIRARRRVRGPILAAFPPVAMSREIKHDANQLS